MAARCATFSAPDLEATGFAFPRVLPALATFAAISPAGCLSNFPIDAVALLARTAEAWIFTQATAHRLIQCRCLIKYSSRHIRRRRPAYNRDGAVNRLTFAALRSLAVSTCHRSRQQSSYVCGADRETCNFNRPKRPILYGTRAILISGS